MEENDKEVEKIYNTLENQYFGANWKAMSKTQKKRLIKAILEEGKMSVK